MAKLGWHLLRSDGRLRFDSRSRQSTELGKGKLVVAGTYLISKAKPILCVKGFHACYSPWDCDEYVSTVSGFGPRLLCRVDVEGKISTYLRSEKFAGQKRKAWWIEPFEPLIKEFEKFAGLSILGRENRLVYSFRDTDNSIKKAFEKWLWKEKGLPTTRAQYEIYKKRLRDADR